ncbi:hypothetical protein EB72_25895 [Mycobacterium sp. SWH-M1]|nr:hypothetical protein EB72_25895 [Mycobacterium sp. SWH-M1]
MFAFPGVGLIDLEDLLDEIVCERVTLGEKTVERSAVGDARLVQRWHELQREDSLFQDLRRAAEATQSADLPYRLAGVDSQRRSVFRAGQSHDHADELGGELDIAARAGQGVQQRAGSRRLTDQPLWRNEGADTLVPHDLAAARQFVQGAAHRDDADSGDLGEFCGARQLVALAQALLFDHVHDQVVDMLITQGTRRPGRVRRCGLVRYPSGHISSKVG